MGTNWQSLGEANLFLSVSIGSVKCVEDTIVKSPFQHVLKIQDTVSVSVSQIHIFCIENSLDNSAESILEN